MLVFWLDDWLLCGAFVCAAGLTADLLWHIETFGGDVLLYWSIGLFTAEMTYTGVFVLVKFSILALYWRIFGTHTSIKLPVVLMSAAVAMWGLAVFLLTLLQCVPTRGFWDKTIQSSCNVNGQNFLFAISIPNILIDVTLLALPAPYVSRLQASKSQRRVILSMFLLGGFVCIASIMRLISVVNQKNNADKSWDYMNQAIWATTEADFAIISAFLPALRPVLPTLRSKSSVQMIKQPPSPPIVTMNKPSRS